MGFGFPIFCAIKLGFWFGFLAIQLEIRQGYFKIQKFYVFVVIDFSINFYFCKVSNNSFGLSVNFFWWSRTFWLGLGQKKVKKFLTNLKLLKNIFWNCLDPNILGLNNFKRLLISIPKCIELKSESKPKLIFVLVCVWVCFGLCLVCVWVCVLSRLNFFLQVNVIFMPIYQIILLFIFIFIKQNGTSLIT